MTQDHKDEVAGYGADVSAKTFLLREYGRQKGDPKLDDLEVPDPIGLGIPGYKKSVEMIKEDIERIAKLLRQKSL
jgi:protein-tyrosine-phosphatase